jgi:uncharacterized protein (TIGR03083 family)
MPVLVPFDDHLTTIRTQAAAFAVDAAAAGPAAMVPTCPRWSTADLARHLGSVHRWATAHAQGVKGKGPEQVAKQAGRDAPAGFDARLRWLVDGADTLVDALAAAPRDLRAARFLSDAPPARAFWARRQAHETTIHRVDAAAARDGRPPKPDEVDLDPAFAADGLDELLTGFLPRNSSRLRRDEPARVLVAPTDRPQRWTVRISAEPPATVRTRTAEPEVLLSGSAAGLYLGLWNRGDGFTVTGDETLAVLWRATVRIRWG